MEDNELMTKAEAIEIRELIDQHLVLCYRLASTY